MNNSPWSSPSTMVSLGGERVELGREGKAPDGLEEGEDYIGVHSVQHGNAHNGGGSSLKQIELNFGVASRCSFVSH